MRNAFLITAVLFSLATAATAAEQKKDAQPQSKQTQQVQMTRSDADGSMDHTSPAQSDCMPKAGKHSKPKKNQQQDDPEADPQAPQNQVKDGVAG
jgi:hypothetical protein